MGGKCCGKAAAHIMLISPICSLKLNSKGVMSVARVCGQGVWERLAVTHLSAFSCARNGTTSEQDHGEVCALPSTPRWP